MNKIVLLVWGVLLFMSSISLFIFSHEAIHVLRIEHPQMMCFGFEDMQLGYVTHYDSFSEKEFNKEELIANLGAGVIVLVFMFSTLYIILTMKGGELNG